MSHTVRGRTWGDAQRVRWDECWQGRVRGEEKASRVELLPGTILNGKYAVDRLQAEGGMSRLYEGHPLQGAARVAIKQLTLVEGASGQEDIEQFEKEYAILRSLDHPGLARALDFFSEGGQHYLVEEFVAGETLEQLVTTAGRLPVEQAVSIAEQLLAVLSHLHEHGVIYRDLKPSNVIMQRDGTARLVDFGAARRWKRDATQDTLALGTPGYAAPEQYGQSQSDARSDLYGLGVLLHFMLTGQAPDPSRGWQFEPPQALVPDVPAAVGQAVLRAVEASAEKRFQTARDMGRALSEAMGRPPAVPQQQGRVTALKTGLVVLGVWVLLAALATPWYVQVRAREKLISCKVNLKNIGTALEMYSTDHGGRYPTWLGALTGRYVKNIPTCPSASRETYSAGYASHASPDAYTIVCKGRHHDGIDGMTQEENYPQYTSVSSCPCR